MWKTYKLSDIGTVVGGATPSTTVEKFYGGDIPWLTPKDLSGFKDRYIERGERNITQEGLNSCSAHLLPENSVLFSSRAPIGYVAIAKNPIATNQGFKSIIPNANVDSLFLYYALKYNKEKIEAMGSGTTFKEVSGAIMKNFEISLPPLEEQRRIAGILGAIDDKIENNRRINTNLELQAQALFEEIFFSDNDWEYTTLGMLTEEVKTKVKGRDAKVLSPISSGELVLSEDYFTKQVYSQDTSKYIVVEPKTFAYNPARINIGSIGINSFDFVGCVSPVYVVFKTKCEYENFFRLFVKSDIFKEEVKSRAIGGVRQTLSYRDFAMITTKHPPIESIRTFNDQYNTLLDIINHNNTENSVLATLRDTLLPKLMNGEIKL